MRIILSIDWNMLSAISTALAMVVALIAIIITVRQLQEMSRSRHLEAMLKVYEIIGNDQCREDRRYLYENLFGVTDFTIIEEAMRKKIESVSTSFDRIGKLVKSNLVPTNEFFESNYEVIIRCWHTLEPYLNAHCNKIGGRHCPHFKYLYSMAVKYHRDHYHFNEISIVTSKGSTKLNLYE